MITLRVRFVTIVLATVLAGGTVWSAVVRPVASFQLLAPNTADTGLTDTVQTPAAPHVDLYGNEIEDALGDYRIDPRGDVYESHSPDTEVTHLSPPTI
jgi:hypothetical protein